MQTFREALAGHKGHPEPEPEYPYTEPEPHPFPEHIIHLYPFKSTPTTTESSQDLQNPNPAKCPPRQSGGLGSCVLECASNVDCSDGATCCENWCGKRCLKLNTK